MIEGELLKKDESKKYNKKLNLIFLKAISEDCPTIEEIEEFLYNFSIKFGDNFNILTKNDNKFEEISRNLNINYYPSIFYEEVSNIRFYGDVRGELETSLKFLREYIEDVPPVKPETKNFLDNLNKNIEINIFSTNMCPACPVMIDVAMKIALNSNNKIILNIFNVLNFRSFVEKYSIMAVPFVVCSNGTSWVGVKTESKLIEELQKTGNGSELP